MSTVESVSVESPSVVVSLPSLVSLSEVSLEVSLLSCEEELDEVSEEVVLEELSAELSLEEDVLPETLPTASAGV